MAPMIFWPPGDFKMPRLDAYSTAALTWAPPRPAPAPVQPCPPPLTLSWWVAALMGLGLPSHAKIMADPSAPGNQRPTVLSSPNGTPVVNIRTPSAAGVSRNTYQQFDVSAQGPILNNARTGQRTQTGGAVAGNPWLAHGTARVILNARHERTRSVARPRCGGRQGRPARQALAAACGPE